MLINNVTLTVYMVCNQNKLVHNLIILKINEQKMLKNLQIKIASYFDSLINEVNLRAEAFLWDEDLEGKFRTQINNERDNLLVENSISDLLNSEIETASLILGFLIQIDSYISNAKKKWIYSSILNKKFFFRNQIACFL